MFYTYVNQLPMVEGNLRLSRGDRLNYSCGILRKSKPDSEGFRAFVLYDKARGVGYRINRNGMMVEYPDHQVFVGSPEELKHTPFAVTGDEAEINSFLLLCGRITEEHKHRQSFVNRLRYYTTEPVGKLILAGGFIYAIITLIVLIFG